MLLNYTKLSPEISPCEINLATNQSQHISTIFILPGLLGMGNNWKQFAKRLLSEFKVDIYLLDLRNHGDSFHDEAMSYELMADDVRRLIASLSLENEPIGLIGHSMGGKVAVNLVNQVVAGACNLNIKGLAVVDMGVTARHNKGLQETIRYLASLNLSHFTGRKEVEENLLDHFKNRLLVGFFGKNLKYDENGKLSWRCNFKVLERKFDFLLEGVDFNDSITIPTLFIKADSSDYITSKDEEVINRFFPHVTITPISAGHWVHFDNPEGLLKSIVDFFANDYE